MHQVITWLSAAVNIIQCYIDVTHTASALDLGGMQVICSLQSSSTYVNLNNQVRIKLSYTVWKISPEQYFHKDSNSQSLCSNFF